MQARMKEHPLTAGQMDSLLDSVEVGHLAWAKMAFPMLPPFTLCA